VQLSYRGGVSEEVLQAEQARIESERTQAERLVKPQATKPLTCSMHSMTR
jgi:hypothetical protein